MDNKRLTKSDMADRVNKIIDEMVDSSKKHGKDLVNLIAEHISQVAGDILNENIDHLKQRIKKRITENGKSTTVNES